MASALGRLGVESNSLRRYDVALGVWIAVLAGVTIYGAATTEGFLTVSNMKAIATAASFVGIIAVGLTVIILSGNLFSLALGQPGKETRFQRQPQRLDFQAMNEIAGKRIGQQMPC